MSSPNSVWTGHMRSDERVVPYGTEDLQHGDLIPYRLSAFGHGTTQMLAVAYFDGYGAGNAITWKVYVKPEMEVVLTDYDDMWNPAKCEVRLNTWADARGYGTLMPESYARIIFPFVDLPYDR